jgi:membrane protein DedA with SNARE-associated domain
MGCSDGPYPILNRPCQAKRPGRVGCSRPPEPSEGVGEPRRVPAPAAGPSTPIRPVLIPEQGAGGGGRSRGGRLASPPVEALLALMERWVAEYGYVAIFLLMLAESACIPFPSEVTMLVGGWYAAEGQLDFFWVGTAGVLGNLVGSWVAYAVGRTTGRALLDRYGRYVLIRGHDIDRAEVWWDRHGEAATFFSRLLPVIRTFISLPAGIAEMPFGKFSVFTFLGVIPWTFALTWAGVIVGHNWERVAHLFDVPTYLIAGALLAAGAEWYRRRRARRRAQAEGNERVHQSSG